MLFSSITFLYYFLPVVFILYFTAPAKYKNPVLFSVSLIFYVWGEPRYVCFMLLSIGIGYAAGILMEKFPKKPIMLTGVLGSAAFLFYFKYADFFLANVNQIFGTKIALLNVGMPIGISFYTFQIISYILDVYTGKVKPQKNILNLATYVTMFPQLIAGPIVRYETIQAELAYREHSAEKMSEGIKRFGTGLAKKVLLANEFGELCGILKSFDEKSAALYWLYALAAALQIYYDFSGYSDMAIGLGQIFGFSFPENFQYPYTSKSITEFWRRWHISLGSWFRDYVYIPLGGNQRGKRQQIFNIFAVWMLTGLWHGAEWNFVFWGFSFAVLLIIEKLWLYDKLKNSRIWGRIYTLFFLLISFVIFSAENLTEAFAYLKGMLFIENIPLLSKECIYYAKSYGLLLLLGILGSTNIPKKQYVRFSQGMWGKKITAIAEPVLLLAGMLIISAYLIDGSYHPFLYFRF